MDIDKKRIDCLAKYNLGWRINEICYTEDVSRATLYRWIVCFKRFGYSGLIRKSTRPKTIYHKLKPDIVNKIINMRKATGANEYVIESRLRSQGIDISHATIYKVLNKNRLINSLSKKRKQKTYIRYERKHPNSMWQTDLTNWKEKVVVAYIDDHSRFITGFGMFNNGLASCVIQVFQQAIIKLWKA